jgi:hypothetical protein
MKLGIASVVAGQRSYRSLTLKNLRNSGAVLPPGCWPPGLTQVAAAEALGVTDRTIRDCASTVAAGGGIQAIIEATGLRTRENVLRLIDPEILAQAHHNDATPPAAPTAPHLTRPQQARARAALRLPSSVALPAFRDTSSVPSGSNIAGSRHTRVWLASD